MSAMVLILMMTYVGLVLFLCYQWQRIPHFQRSKTAQHKTPVSIILPFRNEQAHLGQILNDLSAQDYPVGLFEILAVDDHSTDQSGTIAEAICARMSNLKVIHLDGAGGKKMANKAGIAAANGQLIVTLDADMQISPFWLSSIVAFYEQNTFGFLILPMGMGPSLKPWQHMQAVEFASLLGTGAAMAQAGDPFLCNGGNLAFEKTLFDSLGGYSGNEHISSGDDIFLLSKIRQKHPEKIGYLHDLQAAAYTFPLPSMSAFFRQRIRWGSKTKSMKQGSARWMALLIFATNSLLLLLPLLAIFDSELLQLWWKVALIKWVADLLFLWPICRFYRCLPALRYYPLLAIFYPLYISVAAAAGFFYQPHWKGRKISV